MAHGVSPRTDDVKRDGKEDEDEDEFHEMEQEDLTEDSAEAAAVKKAKSTSATAEGQEPKTPGDEEEWKTAGRTKKTQIPTLPKMEKIPLPGKY